MVVACFATLKRKKGMGSARQERGLDARSVFGEASVKGENPNGPLRKRDLHPGRRTVLPLFREGKKEGGKQSPTRWRRKDRGKTNFSGPSVSREGGGFI